MMGFNYFQDFDDSSYGLREKAKKTWRVSVLDREQSMEDSENRGLIKCHLKKDMDEDMSYHSDKRSRVSILKENTQVGFEVLCPVKKKRSKLRYKVSGFCSVSDFSSVSKFSKFSGEEEAAMSLVMLSSGFTNWDDFVSDFGSAENDSLISKAKSLNRKEIELIFESEPTGVKLGNKKGLGCARADSELIMSGETRVCDQDTELVAKVSSWESKFGEFCPRNAFENLWKGNDFQIKKFSFGEHDTELGVKLTSCDSEHGNFAMRNTFEKPMKGDKFEIDPLDFENGKTNFGDFVPRNEFENLLKDNDFQIKKISFGEHDTELGVRLTSCDSEHGSFVMGNGFEKPLKDDNFEIYPLDSKSEKTNFEDFVPGNAFENLLKGNDFQIKKNNFGEHDTELGVKLTSCDSEHGNFVMRNTFEKPMKGDNFEIDPFDSESGKTKFFRGSEETSFDDRNTELGTNGFVGMEIDDSGRKISENCEKEPEFKCKTCNKKFLSFQALGGHHSKKCHGKSYKMEICYERKKNKCIHECPTCFKVFPSGQALGGHKRAHFVGFSEYKIKQSAAGVTGFSVEEQLGSGFRLRPCGAESDRGPEPVLISFEKKFQV